MLKNLNVKIHSEIKQTDNEEAWLAARRLGIGGSDIGPIMGLSPYTSPLKIYNDKTTLTKTEYSPETLERFHFGHALEDVVAQEFSKRNNLDLYNYEGTVAKPDIPWMLANVDRFILDESGDITGILECKTADSSQKSKWLNGDIPEIYLLQVHWYMYITGLKYAYIACLIGGYTYVDYLIHYNSQYMQTIIVAASDFWFSHILASQPPLMTGCEDENNILNSKYPKAKPNTELWLDTVDFDLEKIEEIKAQIKRLEMDLNKHQNIVKELMQDAETGFTTEYKVTWKQQTICRVDTARLKEEQPDIYKKYTKETTFRKFNVIHLND